MRRGTVLAYHAVGECAAEHDPHKLFVTTEDFREQMDFLARKARVVSLDELVQGGSGGAPAVAITFDDGYRNVLRNAGPILAAHRYPSTIFVPTAYLGATNTWIDPSSCDFGIMTADELDEARSLGIEIESHGHDHIHFDAAGEGAARRDLERSIEIIRKVRGEAPRFLAYPYGPSSRDARRVAAAVGFAAAFSIDARHEGTFAWERTQVTPDDGPRMFALKVSGRYLRLRRSAAGETAWRIARPLVRRVLGRS